MSTETNKALLYRIFDAIAAGDLAALDGQLALSQTGNNEELFLWLNLALANRHQPAVAQADADVKGAAGDASYALERLVLTVTALREQR